MPTFTVVTNTQSGNFQSDGVYMTNIPNVASAQIGPPTNQVCVIGSGSWGKVGVGAYFSDSTSGAAAFGIRTDTVKSLMREALTAMPECSQFLGIRTSDGTDVEATMSLMDTATTPVPVVTFTAVCTGTDGNGASVVANLQSGTLTSNPVLTVTLFNINGSAQIWNNIVAYATAGGAYSAATAIANIVAAVNGTAANQIPSPFFVAAAGASTTTPNLGTAFKASGGTNGDAGVTDTTNIGTQAAVNSTGMYAAQGLIWGSQLVLAGFDTASNFETVAQFAAEQGAEGWFTFPSGTETATAISDKTSNTESDPNMNVIMDWDYVFDAYQQAQILVSPIGKGAGIVASLDPWQYPGNNPEEGAEGVNSTERLSLGAIGITERGQRQSNNINWLDYQNGRWVLAHGLTSNGLQINQIRMQKYIMYAAGQIAARYQGKMVASTVPFAQAPETDARVQLYAALTQLQTQLVGQVSSMAIILGDTNNTSTSLSQGFLMFQLNVTTLTGIQYVIGATDVGNAVSVSAPALPLAA